MAKKSKCYTTERYGLITRTWRLRGCRGMIHRAHGPAIIRSNGDEEYYLNGKRHRENGPAWISSIAKTETWFWHGKIHRENGPAEIVKNFKEVWYFRDLIHRNDGPAFIYHESVANEDTRYRWYWRDEDMPFYKWIRITRCPEEKKVELKLRYSGGGF